MSGAAALSAAKRRRGASNAAPTRSNVSNQQPKRVNAPPQPPSQPQTDPRNQPGQFTPMQMLQQHDSRINKLESDTDCNGDIFNDLNRRIEILEVKNSQESDVLSQVVDERKENNVVESKEDLEYFRNKTIDLEKQISELKQIMLKIQTFANNLIGGFA